MSDDPLESAFAALQDPEPETSAAEIREIARAREAGVVDDVVAEVHELPDARQDEARGARARVLLLAASVALFALGGVLAFVATRTAVVEDDPGQWKGGADAAGALELAFVVEGEQDLLAGSQRSVEPGERVIFTVRTDAPAYACLEERGRGRWERIHPAHGEAWRVDAGRHWPGGDAPLAFVTEHGAGSRAYRVLIDPEHAECTAPVGDDVVEVEWR